MTTIRIFNHGPGPIEIQDAAGRTSMGEGTGNLFQTPVQVNEHGGEVAEQPTGGGPLDESPSLVPGGAAVVPDTEFEVGVPVVTEAQAIADTHGLERPVASVTEAEFRSETGLTPEHDAALAAKVAAEAAASAPQTPPVLALGVGA